MSKALEPQAKVSRVRYFFAQSWPWLLLFWGIPLGVVAGFADEAYLHHQSMLIESLFGSGFGLALFFFVLLPFQRRCGKKNGAPFGVGDEVTVLRGQRRGQLARVHQVWSQTRHVRVRFDTQRTDEEDSVFKYLEVMANRR